MQRLGTGRKNYTGIFKMNIDTRTLKEGESIEYDGSFKNLTINFQPGCAYQMTIKRNKTKAEIDRDYRARKLRNNLKLKRSWIPVGKEIEYDDFVAELTKK